MRFLLLTAPLFLIGCDMLKDVESSPAPATVTESASSVENEPGDSVTPDAVEPGATQRTVAGLGDPGRAGLWLETPLVQQETPGRIRVVSSDASAAVTLIPAKGAATAGSRLSLAAMRELDAPLGDLVELEVTIGS